METGKVWSLQASSTDLINLLASFRLTDSEGRINAAFDENLLSRSQIDEIVDEINQLSLREVVLLTNISSQAGHAKSKSVYVFEVEVCFMQGTLKVNEKDAAQKDAFFDSSPGKWVRVIWIYSKSVKVVDAKLAVFMKYDSYLKHENIYIHHDLENAENVIIYLANQQVDSLVKRIESIKNGVSNIRFEGTIEEVFDEILSKASIRQWCYDSSLRDKNTLVGTIHNASYNCRSMFTVRRLKDQLVEQTLHKAAETFTSEITPRIAERIETDINTHLAEKFSNLKFQISDKLFADIRSVVLLVILSIFNPIAGIMYAVFLVKTFIWSVDVNSEDWRAGIADEIYATIVENKANILSKIGNPLRDVCWDAYEALSEVSDKVDYFKHRLKQTDQKKLVHKWKKRDAFKDLFQKHPSVLTYLTGTRNGKHVVKVFLTGDDKKDDELRIRSRYSSVHFEFVDVDTGYEDVLNKMKKIEKLEQSAPEIDKESREKMNEVIKRNAEFLFANHSGVIGIEKSNVRSDKMLNELCIVFLCLDESIVPYGESPLPKYLEGYPCDIREEFVMFGHCIGCQTLNIGCSIGIPFDNLAGSVGFFVRSNDSTQGISKSGFLTAAHVAIQHCDELYEHQSLLSENILANMSHQIVHPSYADNPANVVIGEVIESYFGNWTNGTGIDAAFVQTNQRNFGEKIHLPDENSLQFNGSLLVKKRGRTTGDTIGKLVDDCLYICVDSTKVQGRYYVFEKCFAVKGRDETKFFDKGDSGSGVFLIDKKDNSLKALGIAFAFFQTKTAVCKIRQITDAFNVSVYGYEEPMDIS